MTLSLAVSALIALGVLGLWGLFQLGFHLGVEVGKANLFHGETDLAQKGQ